MGPSGLSERALVALRTSKLSKNCASRGLVGPFRRAARAEKGPPGLQGGAAVPAAPPPLATCLPTINGTNFWISDAHLWYFVNTQAQRAQQVPHRTLLPHKQTEAIFVTSSKKPPFGNFSLRHIMRS